jgi:hypothetical protein
MKKTRNNRMSTSSDRRRGKSFGANSVLVSMWETILADKNITTSKFERLMHDFLRDPRNGIPNNRVGHTQHRGNTVKQLLNRDKMTWKVFIKALRFMQFSELEFILKGTIHGVKSEHSVKIDFGTIEYDEPQEQEQGTQNELILQHSAKEQERDIGLSWAEQQQQSDASREWHRFKSRIGDANRNQETGTTSYIGPPWQE